MAQVLLSSLNRSFSETLQLKPADVHDPQMCELDKFLRTSSSTSLCA